MAWKSSSAPTASRASARAFSLAGPGGALKYRSSEARTRSLAALTAAEALPALQHEASGGGAATAGRARATSKASRRTGNLRNPFGRAGMPRSSGWRNGECTRASESASRLLQRGPGDLGVEQGLDPLAVRPRPQEHVLQKLPRLAQAAVEGESRLQRQLLADGRLVRVAEHALPGLFQLAERLPDLEAHEVLGPALLRESVAQVRLGLADARQLLRDVQRAPQRQDRVRGLLVVGVVGEGSLRIVGAAGVVPGGAPDQRDVWVQLGPFDVQCSGPRRHLLRRGARLRALLQRLAQHLVLVRLRGRLGQFLLDDLQRLLGSLADEQPDARESERGVLDRLGRPRLDLLGQVVELHRVRLGDLFALLREELLRALPVLGQAGAHLHYALARFPGRLVPPVGARHVEGGLVVCALQERGHRSHQVFGRLFAGAVLPE